MLVVAPEVHTYDLDESYGDRTDTYVVIEKLGNGQLVIQHIKHLFWIFWWADERPFPTWPDCIQVREEK